MFFHGGIGGLRIAGEDCCGDRIVLVQRAVDHFFFADDLAQLADEDGLMGLGVVATPSEPQAFYEEMKRDLQKNKEIAQAANLKLD